MRGYIKSRRFSWPATIATVGVLAAVLVVVATFFWDSGEGQVDVVAEDLAQALLRLDDGAAEAEARILLASLRATLAEGTTSQSNGEHVRYLATQLDRTLPTARLERADAGDAGPILETLKTQLQASDPFAVTTIVDLERALRWSDVRSSAMR